MCVDLDHVTESWVSSWVATAFDGRWVFFVDKKWVFFVDSSKIFPGHDWLKNGVIPSVRILKTTSALKA